MTDLETCREHILSEEYRDFIGNHVRTPFFDSIMKDDLCVQDAGFDYKCFYFPKETVEPVTLSKFSYNSIPKCFAPLSMETLNQTGILPIQNYPTLQLKGEGVLIGFLDSGIDYTNEVFRNIDGSTRIAAIWDQTVQSGTPPEGFAYGSEFTKMQINEALEQEKEELKVAIYSEELQKPKITKDHIAFWISKFRDTDLTDAASRKRLVESFVNAVFVYDDKVVFTFNYKDGSKTATIDEINAELGSDLDGTTPPVKT